jgi:hypothetical protein
MSERRQPPPLRGDEDELFVRYDQALHQSTRRWINTTEANIDDACAYAWSRLLARQPDRETVFPWLRVVARNQALLLDRQDRAHAHQHEFDVERVDDGGAAMRRFEAGMLAKQATQLRRSGVGSRWDGRWYLTAAGPALEDRLKQSDCVTEGPAALG